MHSSHTTNIIPTQTGLLNLKINVMGRDINSAVDIFNESSGRTKSKSPERDSQFKIAAEQNNNPVVNNVAKRKRSL